MRFLDFAGLVDVVEMQLSILRIVDESEWPTIGPDFWGERVATGEIESDLAHDPQDCGSLPWVSDCGHFFHDAGLTNWNQH